MLRPKIDGEGLGSLPIERQGDPCVFQNGLWDPRPQRVVIVPNDSRNPGKYTGRIDALVHSRIMKGRQ